MITRRDEMRTLFIPLLRVGIGLLLVFKTSLIYTVLDASGEVS